MAVYLGSSKQHVNVGGDIVNLNMHPSTVVTSGATLLSSEGYILRDVNGLYLTTKEDEE